MGGRLNLTDAPGSSSPRQAWPRGKSGWRSESALVVAIAALAFGLRVFRLGTQSLWGDETTSVFRAYASIPGITEAMTHEGTLPPLYYYLLHFWIRLAGTTETSVRYLSVVFGVLAIPLLYLLVRRTMSARVGIFAAILAAISPFWVYYAQETRTYSLVTMLVVLAVYLLVRAAADPSGSKWLWCAYAVAATLAVASFYFAGFVLAAACCWLLTDRHCWPSVAVRCFLAQVGALVLLAPLFAYAGPSLIRESRSVSRAGVPLTTVLRQLATTFNFGTSVDPSQVTRLVVLALALAALGLLGSPWRQSLLWALLVIVPVLAIDEVSFVPHAGWERYFITASPAWYTLVAAGLSALAPWPHPPAPSPPSVARGKTPAALRSATSPSPFPMERGQGGEAHQIATTAIRYGLAIAATAALLSGIVPSLHNYYFDPTYWRNDLRAAERPVEAIATPDVAVIVNGPPQFPSFFYYFRKTVPWFELPAPRTTGEQTIATLDGLAKRYRGLWFVKYHPSDFDPGNYVEEWLDHHSYRVSSRWVENLTFGFYVSDDPISPRIVGASSVGRRFGDDAELVSYRASVVRAQGADYLLVTLSWRALRTPSQSVRVFAHLLDRSGTLLSQSDHFPEADLRPASVWRSGEVMDDRFGLKLPPSPAGRGLHLSVGLYHPDGSRLAVQGEAKSDGSLTLPLPGLDARQ